MFIFLIKSLLICDRCIFASFARFYYKVIIFFIITIDTRLCICYIEVVKKSAKKKAIS